jgi:hypothetical protein
MGKNAAKSRGSTDHRQPKTRYFLPKRLTLSLVATNLETGGESFRFSPVFTLVTFADRS